MFHSNEFVMFVDHCKRPDLLLSWLLFFVQLWPTQFQSMTGHAVG